MQSLPAGGGYAEAVTPSANGVVRHAARDGTKLVLI